MRLDLVLYKETSTKFQFCKLCKEEISMILYGDEFEKVNPPQYRQIAIFEKAPILLHEMSVDELLKFIARNGSASVNRQYLAIRDYFRWLTLEKGIDMSSKNLDLKLGRNEVKKHLGFFTLEDLKSGINEDFQKIDNSDIYIDFSGLKAIFFLEWYGVTAKNAISILLSDVSDDGKEVFVPSENRKIYINDIDVSQYFAEYKQKIGHKKHPSYSKITLYNQNTFYRNTNSRSKISEKTIYNNRKSFVEITHDIRVQNNRIYRSGRFSELFNLEKNELIKNNDISDILKRVYNKPNMVQNEINRELQLYSIYRKEMLNRA